MAWTSMHFAVGMGCTGAAVSAACLYMKRGWRWLPLAMTLGGIWAIAPDLPRIWREDFTWLPFASTFGQRSLEVWLHSIGDLFFFHKALDAQPNEYALHGLAIILILYNLSIALLLRMEHKARKRLGAWDAHQDTIAKIHRQREPGWRFDGDPVDPDDLKKTG
ncbi:MAG: hypothetical protein WD768_17095 [Phycisphaeraceae bacterium]